MGILIKIFKSFSLFMFWIQFSQTYYHAYSIFQIVFILLRLIKVLHLSYAINCKSIYSIKNKMARVSVCVRCRELTDRLKCRQFAWGFQMHIGCAPEANLFLNLYPFLRFFFFFSRYFWDIFCCSDRTQPI